MGSLMKEDCPRFGKYWTTGTGSWMGCSARKGSGDPRNRSVRLWLLAAPWRVGPSAPRRWPSLQPEEMPPYLQRFYYEISSLALTNKLRLSDNPFAIQRLRDLKAHIHEGYRRRSGYFWAEMDAIELYRRHDQLRWFMDAKVDDMALNFSGKDHKAYDGTIQSVGHNGTGVGRDSSIADAAGYAFEEVDNTIALRRIKYGRPLRERQKSGRKPIGDRAMTTAERVAGHRTKALPAPLERPQPGIVVPSQPQGPIVSGTPYEEVAQMVTNLINVELAEKYHQYLGEVLDRLMSAPPDHILSREEFTVIAAAAVLADRLMPKQLH